MTANPAAFAFSVSNMVSMRIDVHAAFDQPPRLLAIGSGKLIEAYVAEAGIVHVGRKRSGAVCRPDGARDEARLVRRQRGIFVRRLPRELGRRDVHLKGQRFHAVVGHGDGLRVKGVAFDDIGAGLKIGFVDAADDVRLRQDKEIVVAFKIARPILEALAPVIGFPELVALDHGAHRAIEDQNPCRGGFVQCGDAFVTVHSMCP